MPEWVLVNWIEGWFFDLIHSDSGVNEKHCVFREALSAPFVFCQRGQTCWYTVTFDRSARRFQAVLLSGTLTLTLFEFTFERVAGDRFRLRWVSTATARNADGARLLREPGYERRAVEMLQSLATAIDHYLATERCFRVPARRKAYVVTSRLGARVRRHFVERGEGPAVRCRS